jgi:CheY-like chemotaxis protein
LAALAAGKPDCCVLDPRLADMEAAALVEAIQANRELAGVPLVVYTASEPSAQERALLRLPASSIVVKDATSPQRLYDETALFLHRKVADLPAARRAMLEDLHRSTERLNGRVMLVVDDDARNIFALTTLLENYQIKVLSATTGRRAIQIVQSTPDLDAVLMDIMMPDMDGYETMRRIRGLSDFAALPILALTAKAMKGDRQKCLEAGASDYIAKPVNAEQLLSLLRVWLCR